MLEIVRGRTWRVDHTVLDYADGPESDLSGFTSAKCEIRERVSQRLGNGDFIQPLVLEVPVSIDGARITLSLTRQQTTRLRLGTYLLDVVLTTSSGEDWTAIPPEPVLVSDQPTQP